MTKGVFPISLAQVLACETTHAGESEIPYGENDLNGRNINIKRMLSRYQIQHFARGDEVMQPIHELFNSGVKVVPVNVEYVDVVSAEFLKGRFDRYMKRLDTVPDVVGHLRDRSVPAFPMSRVLRVR